MGSDSYLVSARKHRPQTFKDLVSQTHVTETLQNAINRNRVGQAYLFSGPRGVGKTTVARLLAKAINCQTELDKREGAEPCGTCESCKTIGEGRSMNIIEIDAASNNGVEDARDLRDTVRIPPQGALKKVYIIDEVHMMSNQAFNALLKTLEEPPDYVHFIFATTEPKKVLPTILSRCQRFNFRRISVQETYERLRHICEVENIKADEASLMLIARKGDGALRDALSSFDQAISLCGTDITYDALSSALGLIDNDRYFEVTDLIAKSDRPALISLLNQVISEGFDLEEFVSGLSEHLRNLYLARSMDSTDLIDADAETKKKYADVAESFSEVDLMRLLMLASDTENGLRRAIHPRLSLELGLLKMASMSSTTELKELLEIVKKANSNPALAATTNSPKKTSTPSQSGSAKSAVAPSASDSSSSPKASSASRIEAKNTISPGTSAAVKLHVQEAPAVAVENEVAPIAVANEEVVEQAAAQKNTESNVSSEESKIDEEAEKEQVENSKSANDESEVSIPEPSHEQPQKDSLSIVSFEKEASQSTTLFGSAALSSVSSDDKKEKETKKPDSKAKVVVKELSQGLVHLKSVWPKFCKEVIGERIQIGALLQHASLENYSADTVWLQVPDNLHLELLGSESDYLIKKLQSMAKDFAINQMEIVCDENGESSSELQPDTEKIQKGDLDKIKSDNPVIRDLLDRFDATIVW